MPPNEWLLLLFCSQLCDYTTLCLYAPLNSKHHSWGKSTTPSTRTKQKVTGHLT